MKCLILYDLNPDGLFDENGNPHESILTAHYAIKDGEMIKNRMVFGYFAAVNEKGDFKVGNCNTFSKLKKSFEVLDWYKTMNEAELAVSNFKKLNFNF